MIETLVQTATKYLSRDLTNPWRYLASVTGVLAVAPALWGGPRAGALTSLQDIALWAGAPEFARWLDEPLGWLTVRAGLVGLACGLFAIVCLIAAWAGGHRAAPTGIIALSVWADSFGTSFVDVWAAVLTAVIVIWFAVVIGAHFVRDRDVRGWLNGAAFGTTHFTFDLLFSTALVPAQLLIWGLARKALQPERDEFAPAPGAVTPRPVATA